MLPQIEISCHISKLAIFLKVFGDLMSYVIREYADEEIKFLRNVLLLKNRDILLSPFIVFSLYSTACAVALSVSMALYESHSSTLLYSPA